LTNECRTGSFKSPPPGRPVGEGCPPGLAVGLELGERDINRDPVARRHFRVVVICPCEVERTDLSDPISARRMLWRFEEREGTWSREVLWP
jgi:pyridoxamine 5'-phosphate oxidase